MLYLVRPTHISQLMFSSQTAVGITTLILTAACHPEAQARVQEEIDAVVGKDRGEHMKNSCYR
jgi:hypothetical protein